MWQPIETAPKDKLISLWFPKSDRVVHDCKWMYGRWCWWGVDDDDRLPDDKSRWCFFDDNEEPSHWLFIGKPDMMEKKNDP